MCCKDSAAVRMGAAWLPSLSLFALGWWGTSHHNPGAELRKCALSVHWWCKLKRDVPGALHLTWHLQGHCLLLTTCPPSSKGVTLDKNMLKYYLLLPSPEPPSGSHQSWSCDTSGTRS